MAPEIRDEEGSTERLAYWVGLVLRDLRENARDKDGGEIEMEDVGRVVGQSAKTIERAEVGHVAGGVRRYSLSRVDRVLGGYSYMFNENDLRDFWEKILRAALDRWRAEGAAPDLDALPGAGRVKPVVGRHAQEALRRLRQAPSATKSDRRVDRNKRRGVQ